MWTVSTSGQVSAHVSRRSHACQAPRTALVQIVLIRTLITNKQGTEPGRSIERGPDIGQHL